MFEAEDNMDNRAVETPYLVKEPLTLSGQNLSRVYPMAACTLDVLSFEALMLDFNFVLS